MADTTSKLVVTNLTNNTTVILTQITDAQRNTLTTDLGVVIYSQRGLQFWDGDEWI